MKFLNRFKRKNQPDSPGEPGAASPPSTGGGSAPANGTENPPNAGVDDICLRLGDFLHRIPAHLLQAGPHDLQKEVRFPISAISDRINRGETTVNLVEIYRQLPEVFRSEVREADKQQVLYPWRKVIAMLKEARGDSAAPEAAAENLAEKIRQKKPGVRGASAATPPAPQTPILRGRGKQQASWFSRTTLEKGAEGTAPPAAPSARGNAAAAAPDPAAKGKAGAPASAKSEGISSSATTGDAALANAEGLDAILANPATPEPAAPAEPSNTGLRLKLVTSDQPESPAPLEKPVTPPALKTAAPPTRSGESELADLPPEVQRRVAMIKGDYERQLAELELARKTYAAEVDRLQTELAQTADRLDEECTANSASRDLLQQASREREATQQQIAALQQKMEELQKDSRLSAITAERDALLQQKAHLSKQISELSKRGASPQPRNGDGGAASGVLQRQVEDFQRRISLMEAAQRDTALELAREKEARAKAEKLLTAAEKLQEQSANYMETAKAEIRKEIEASVKPREIEARKAQKELQDQIAQLTDQNRKLATELENARVARSEAAARKPADAGVDLQAQAISQLEADVENYRDRLKSLLKERDAARAEAKSLAANVSSAKDAEEASAARAQLQEEFERLRKEHAEQSAALETLRQERAAAEERLASERSAFESRFDSLRQALDAAQHAHAAQLATLEKAAEERAKQGAAADGAPPGELRRQADEALAAAKAAREELSELRARFEEVTASRAELAGELERERAGMAAEREATAARLREQSHSLEQQLAKAVQERDELAAKQAELLQTTESDRSSRDELLANLERDHTAVVRAKEELAQRLADAERALEKNAREREQLARSADGLLGDPALVAAVSALKAQVAELEQQRAAANSRAEAAEQKAAEEARQARAAHDQLSSQFSAARSGAEQAAGELAAARAELSDARKRIEELGKLPDERDAARRERDALAKDLDARNAALEEARQRESKLEAQFAEERQKIAAERAAELGRRDDAIKQLTIERDQANGARENVAQDLAAAQKSLGELTAALEGERQKGGDLAQAAQLRSADASRLEAELTAARETAKKAADEAAAQKSMSEKLKGALTHVERALAQEREDAARQRAEMEKQIAESARTATQVVQQSAAELAEARESAESARQAASASAARLAKLEKELSEGRAQQAAAQSRLKELETSAQRANEHLEELKRRLASAHEDAAASLQNAARRHEEDAARARREVATLQTERDNLAQQRDELLRRLTRITEEHKRLLDDLTSAPKIMPAPVASEEVAEPRESQPANVIEVTIPDVLPPEPANGINIPRVRPVNIPPPKVSTL